MLSPDPGRVAQMKSAGIQGESHMWKIAPWLCAGIVIGVGLVSMSGDRLTAQPVGVSGRYTDPACAFSGAGSSFICVADLDGNGQKEVIVGEDNAYNPTPSNNTTYSYVNIIDKTGAIRGQTCWIGANPSTSAPGTSAMCPPITSNANTPR
jgi:hypothetical protein